MILIFASAKICCEWKLASFHDIFLEKKK